MGGVASEPEIPDSEIRVRYVQPNRDEAGNSLTWEFVKTLRISHDNNNPNWSIICFQQIEIYGVDGINYALQENGGSAKQSSHQYPEDKLWGHAYCVIDGDPSGHANETSHQLPNGWLEVTLSKAQWIESFALFNSGFDACVWANGSLVQLLDEDHQVVYEHRLSTTDDLPLFDPGQNCAMKFVFEDSKVVMVKLTLESCDADTVTWSQNTQNFFTSSLFLFSVSEHSPKGWSLKGQKQSSYHSLPITR